MHEATNTTAKPTLGIGSCLAGNKVRYNGQEKKPNQAVRELCEHFDTRSFCPEMAIGLGVPRPPIHLLRSQGSIRVVDVATQTKDYTDPIRAYAGQVLELAPELCGYILVKGSPSCGYSKVKRYDEDGNLVAYDQRGIFADALARLDPLLPLEDDSALTDPERRENFFTRASTYHAWKLLLLEGIQATTLLDFYNRHKHLVMTHRPASDKILGPMLANTKKEGITPLAQRFIATLMADLAHPDN